MTPILAIAIIILVALPISVIVIAGHRAAQRRARISWTPTPITTRGAYSQPVYGQVTDAARAELRRRDAAQAAGLCPIDGQPVISSWQRQIPRHLRAAYEESRDAEIERRTAELINTHAVDPWWRPPAPKVESEKPIPVEGTIFDRMRKGHD